MIFTMANQFKLKWLLPSFTTSSPTNNFLLLLTSPSHIVLFVTQIYQAHFRFRFFAFTMFPWLSMSFSPIFSQLTFYSGISLNIISDNSSMIPPYILLLTLCSIFLLDFLHFQRIQKLFFLTLPSLTSLFKTPCILCYLTDLDPDTYYRMNYLSLPIYHTCLAQLNIFISDPWSVLTITTSSLFIHSLAYHTYFQPHNFPTVAFAKVINDPQIALSLSPFLLGFSYLLFLCFRVFLRFCSQPTTLTTLCTVTE